jgi:hypothetical protein
VSFALADNTRSTYANFLYELQGSIQEVFPSEAPFLAEISGFDVHQGIVDRASRSSGSPRRWTGTVTGSTASGFATRSSSRG